MSTAQNSSIVNLHSHMQTENDTDYTCGWPMVIGIGLCLSAGLLFVWQGSLEGDFHFDDYANIVNNDEIRSIWLLNPFLSSGRPFGLYTFAINYHFSQVNPVPYLLTNLLIHISNALLIYIGVLLSRTLWLAKQSVRVESSEQKRWLYTAAIAALLWGIHPITTQAVTYIVQRYESLATLGYLGAWVGMLLVISSRRWGLLVLVLSAWVGLLSKQIFATAPLAIVLFDRWITQTPFRDIFKQRWLAYSLLLTPYVWFIPNVLRWFDPSRSSSMGFGLKAISSWEYLRTQPEIIFHYLGLTLWPEPVCFDYVWQIQNYSMVYFTLGGLILLALAFAAWLYWRGINQSNVTTNSAQLGLCGWMILTFFFILAPTSSFVPIADLCVEHRMYLPSAIIVIGATLLAAKLLESLQSRSDRPTMIRLGFGFAFLGILLIFAGKTHLRNRDYQDGIALWNSVLAVRSDNPRAWYMLGKQYYDRGQYMQALPNLERAASYPQTLGEFHVGLADCLREVNRPDSAMHEYRRAISLRPKLAEAYNGIGVLLHRRGELPAAVSAYQKAVELDSAEASYNLASILMDVQMFSEALPLLEASIQDHPEFSLSVRRLAWILATAPDEKLRNGHRARNLMAQYFSLDESDSPYVWDTHAAVLAEIGDFEGAVEAANEALKLCQTRSDKSLEVEIDKRLEAYREQRPWREGVAS